MDSSWIKDMNLKHKTLKPMQKLGEIFYYHGIRKTFVSMTQNVVVIKNKQNKNKKQFLQVSFVKKCIYYIHICIDWLWEDICNTGNSDCLLGRRLGRLTQELGIVCNYLFPKCK